MESLFDPQSVGDSISFVFQGPFSLLERACSSGQRLRNLYTLQSVSLCLVEACERPGVLFPADLGQWLTSSR